jgi:hypothetical protein
MDKSKSKKGYGEIILCSIALIILVGFGLIGNHIYFINKIDQLEKIKDEKIVVECKTHGQIMEGDIICYRNFEEEIFYHKILMVVLSLLCILLLILLIQHFLEGIDLEKFKN